MESLISYRGDLRIAEACAANDIPFVQSGTSLIRLEALHEACPAAWFQAYLTRRYDDMKALLRRVEKAGFETLVITVDMTAGGNRENMVRAGFSAPFRPSLRLLWDGATHPRWSIGNFIQTIVRHGMPHFENIDGGRGAPIISKTEMLDNNRSMHNWEVIRSIRADWTGNLVIKGLLDPRDVRISADIGVDGIIVSSHGGRQIDGVVPPIRTLSACVAAAGEVPVMIDSGIRRGTDIIKCLALGARFVFVGRPFNYAAILGREGVEHAIALLRSELNRDMGNMGLNSLAEITRECLAQVPGV
jgi:L-lactate dehydrogenase (cytochrome)